MNRYKFRAECIQDIINLNKLLTRNKIKATIETNQNNEFPDCEAIISTEITLDEIILIIKKIVNGHVMLQTIKLFNEYDGKRNYNL